jgi:hypothetical protein
MEIKFSSNYPKLHNQTTAELLAVKDVFFHNKKTPELLEYDTKKEDGTYYELKNGIYLQLIFLGNLGIPFCTLRSGYPLSKIKFYEDNIGETFEIKIVK